MIFIAVKPSITQLATLLWLHDLLTIMILGTATTGRVHIAYLVPMCKIAHLLRAGCVVKVLLAEIHAFLDAMKAPMELVKYRAEYYRFAITSILRAIGVPIDRLEFSLVIHPSIHLSIDLIKHRVVRTSCRVNTLSICTD